MEGGERLAHGARVHPAGMDAERGRLGAEEPMERVGDDDLAALRTRVGAHTVVAVLALDPVRELGRSEALRVGAAGRHPHEASAARAQPRQQRLGEDQRAEEVHGVRQLEALWGADPLEGQEASVVDDAIEGRRRRRARGGAHRCEVGQISEQDGGAASPRGEDLALERGRPPGVPAQELEVRPSTGEPQGEGMPDALGGPGHEVVPALQVRGERRPREPPRVTLEASTVEGAPDEQVLKGRRHGRGRCEGRGPGSRQGGPRSGAADASGERAG